MHQDKVPTTCPSPPFRFFGIFSPPVSLPVPKKNPFQHSGHCFLPPFSVQLFVSQSPPLFLNSPPTGQEKPSPSAPVQVATHSSPSSSQSPPFLQSLCSVHCSLRLSYTAYLKELPPCASTTLQSPSPGVSPSPLHPSLCMIPSFCSPAPSLGSPCFPPHSAP